MPLLDPSPRPVPQEKMASSPLGFFSNSLHTSSRIGGMGCTRRNMAQLAGNQSEMVCCRQKVARLDTPGYRVSRKPDGSCRRASPGCKGCGTACILFSATCPLSTFPLHPPHFQTLAGIQGQSGYSYLAGQDLSSDSAAHKGLHVLPCLLLLHRGGSVEGDFHHGESSGCAVRRGSNQSPGLQVGRGDPAYPSSTYFLPCLPKAAASPGLRLLMTQSQAGWETVGGHREVLREEREGAQELEWRG